VAIYAAIAAAGVFLLGSRLRRRWLAPRRAAVLALAVLTALVVVGLAGGPGRRAAGGPAPGLRAAVLDVGQGDAILLDPSPGQPILVDGGPPGDGLEAQLQANGVSRLAAAVVTHDQSDHVGGIEDLLGAFPVQRLVYAVPAPGLLRRARAAGAQPVEVAKDSEVDSGGLRLQVIWPPPDLERGAGARAVDPNTLAIVAVARWHGFSMLLTADAEAESVPLDPGAIDVLKVAHHGSADAGLGPLLDRTKPRLAVISVGAGNPYGHPTAQTLATLAAHDVPVLRTDLDGTVEIDVDRSGWVAR
jgi:competence protein ComEC